MDFNSAKEEIVFLDHRHNIALPQNASIMMIRYLDENGELIGETIIKLIK